MRRGIHGHDFSVDESQFRTKAIRQKCLECCCGNAAEARRCHITDCTLWSWRIVRGSRARLELWAAAPNEAKKIAGNQLRELMEL